MTFDIMAAPADVPPTVPPRCSSLCNALSTPDSAKVVASLDCCPPQIQTADAASIAATVIKPRSLSVSDESTTTTWEIPDSASHFVDESAASFGSDAASAITTNDPSPRRDSLSAIRTSSGTEPPPTMISVPGHPSAASTGPSAPTANPGPMKSMAIVRRSTDAVTRRILKKTRV